MYDEQIQLIERLAERTKSGVVDWKTSAEDDMFQASFKNNTVAISKIESTRGSSLYVMMLINSVGVVVESFNDRDIDQLVYGSVGTHTHSTMRELFEGARRRALGADKVLKQILKDLE